MGPADAIVVLDGSFLERAVEAADLFRAGFAPRILISRGGRDASEAFFDAEGVHLPTRAEVARDVLVTHLGLPGSAIETLTEPVNSTADEASLVGRRVARAGWTRVIVITDLASTRRAGHAFRKALGPNVAVIVWSSRRDGYDPAHWWATRATVRTTFYELPKMLVYWIGLGG
jgi:uncharacterized SAM-binding protein YcdF (DUF218 family)